MKLREAVFCLAWVALAPAAWADDAPAPSGATPWIDDQALIKQTEDDIQTGGILAVEKHRDQLEHALAGAEQSIRLAGAQRPISYVLTDGPGELILALSVAATDKKSGVTNVTAIDNPYPKISFYLGSYYDEIEKPAEALRVLDAGLAASVVPDLDLGTQRQYVLVERGAALMVLRRWQDVLDNEDRALKADDLENGVKARLYRGRGYALTELNKLDEAEDAYKESLNLEPDSELAKNELRYIAGLKHGAPPAAAGNLTKVQKTPSDAPPQGTPQ